MSNVSSMASLSERAGAELGVTDWRTVDQDTIHAFAECTGDRQWIHVDEARARRESPFGGTVAHGLLSLSLLPAWQFELLPMPDDAASALNYGFDKVRFLTPVRAGSRVRDRVKLVSVTDKREGLLLATEHTVEIEGEQKPALVAAFLVLLVPG